MDFDRYLQFDSLGVRDGQDDRTSGSRILPFSRLNSELNEADRSLHMGAPWHLYYGERATLDDVTKCMA